jgi:ATP-binding protein involved in chromosome partitioning
MAHQYGIELLGSLPLDVQIREGVDNGNPSVASDPNSKVSGVYRDIARNIAAKISLQARDYTNKFPKIVVENN